MARGEASWTDEAGVRHVTAMTLVDTSPSGACIQVKKPISVGAQLTIKWHKEMFLASVRNCRPQGEAYILGLQRVPVENVDSK